MEPTNNNNNTNSSSSGECIELKNIKYKSMMLSGNSNAMRETKSSSNEDLCNLDKFLENNKSMSQVEQWSKLDMTMKTKKMVLFAEEYTKENELDHEESLLLIAFLKDCLGRKKIQRVKDVIYDKTTGLITSVPALVYNKQRRHFTLKNMDKLRVSTLKSLPPTKNHANNGTIKNKLIVESERVA